MPLTSVAHCHVSPRAHIGLNMNIGQLNGTGVMVSTRYYCGITLGFDAKFLLLMSHQYSGAKHFNNVALANSRTAHLARKLSFHTYIWYLWRLCVLPVFADFYSSQKCLNIVFKAFCQKRNIERSACPDASHAFHLRRR